MNEKRGLGKYFGIALLSTIFIFGLFAILIVSHEAYHYFSVEGEAQGICFGNCATDSAGMMVSGVYFEEINTDKTDIVENEKHAWQFSSAFTGLFALLSIYSLYRYRF